MAKATKNIAASVRAGGGDGGGTILPPIAVADLLMGSGHMVIGLKALLLTLTNIICVNLPACGCFCFRASAPFLLGGGAGQAHVGMGRRHLDRIAGVVDRGDLSESTIHTILTSAKRLKTI